MKSLSRVTRKSCYKKASKLLCNIFINNGACYSLAQATKYDPQMQDYFRYYFSPNIPYSSGYWWGATYNEENQLARSLALLFMAEMS